MADTLRMAFSLTATEELSAGNSQTHTVIDSVAQRTWGGSMSRVYDAGVDSDKIAVWEGVVVQEEDAAEDNDKGLDANAWNKGSTSPTRGSVPSTAAKVLAVEYVSSIGTDPNLVYVYIANEGSGTKACLASLLPGEGCVIPLEELVAYDAAITGAVDAIDTAGIAPAKLHITVDDYDSGTNEATVNVLVAGR